MTQNLARVDQPSGDGPIGFFWPGVFLGVALAAVIIGAITSTKMLVVVESRVAEAQEQARPAEVQLISITAPGCDGCFALDSAIANLKQQAVTVTEEKAVPYTEEAAQSLLQELEITRVPTFVLTGEVSKENLQGFVTDNGRIAKDKFVFTKVAPLYIDPATQKTRGGVSVTALTDPLCTDCIDVAQFIAGYKQAGVKITGEEQVEWSSAPGLNLIRRYAITKLPTVIFSSELGVYEEIRDAWVRAGTVESDGVFVLRNLAPPYRDVDKGRVIGLVDALYLADTSCGDCYKPEEVLKNIFARQFGIKLRSERLVEISSPEGKRLIAQYQVNQVPTILLSSEVSEYENLKSVWQRVGTVEEDGWYVFRQLNQLGEAIYKDLSSNEMVRPQPEQNNNQ